MLISARSLRHCHLHARDGAIGRVKDLFFDDRAWTVRYLAVDTDGWLHGHEVLVSPEHVQRVDSDAGDLEEDLTTEQIRHSPPLESAMPVSRQFELDYHEYYGTAPYWEGAPFVGAGLPPAPATPDVGPAAVGREANPRVRRYGEVEGYYVEARDGDIGHIHDLLIDDEHWVVRALVVDTRNWLPGRHVLIIPATVLEVSWQVHRVFVDADREAVRSAPDYDPDQPLSEDDELRLYRHYRAHQHPHTA